MSAVLGVLLFKLRALGLIVLTASFRLARPKGFIWGLQSGCTICTLDFVIYKRKWKSGVQSTLKRSIR